MATMVEGFPVILPNASLTSCRPLLSLLQEEDAKLKFFALKQLEALVDSNWAEIADHIETIEELYEDDKFENRELAAIVASKVHYNLEQFDESLTYALGAGALFTDQMTAGKPSQYIFTILSKVIDRYIADRLEQAGSPDVEKAPIDPRLEAIVETMFERCFAEGNIRQAVGIALESVRLDKLEQCIQVATDRAAILSYTLEACQTLAQSRGFRDQVLKVLVAQYRQLDTPDYQSMCHCLMLLEDDKSVASLLSELIKKENDDSELLAYQIAFDLCESDMQHFLLGVRNGLPTVERPPAPAPAPAPPAGDAGAEGGDTEMQDVAAVPPAAPELSEEEKKLEARVANMRSILSGEKTIGISLEFLFANNNTDMLILNNMKGALEPRNSITHQATVFANAVMHCGTTVDKFVQDNPDWFKKASNWAKFSAAACVGMIYKGCINSSRTVLKTYLPDGENGGVGGPFATGGALYALGLIHANHGEGILKFLVNELKNNKGGDDKSETIQHGACLGIGLAGMATDNEELLEDLKSVLFTDSAVAGEAAGLAMGLVMLGTANGRVCEEMLSYAQDTQHEKIIRGLSIGMALIMFGREEGADTLIEQLTRHKDPILRYGGMYTIATAYAGTGSNKAIRRLLHVAVSDVSNDVRRAAVTCLGFVLSASPEQCPRVVSLLAESYNPHVRYGSAMAVGIACAGTGLEEAINLLEPMTKDATDFVRQGAMLALSLVLVQETDARQPKVKDIRGIFESVIKDKHEDVMAKFGAIIANSILDAGGRNVTISMSTKSGTKKMSAVVGMVVFMQYWYWFPLAHFISLTFTPTCVIGLNKELKMPVVDFVSNTKPSTFAYPPKTEVKTSAAPTKVATAILSTTAKTEARKKDKADEKQEGDHKMDVDGKEAKASESKEGEQGSKEGEEGKEGEDEKKDSDKKKDDKEPTFTNLANPARCLIAQKKFMTMPSECR
jgi:26S proteasome regulatory subunit N2